MYHLYVLKNEKIGKTYTGFTKDLKQRLEQHRYDFKRGYELVHSESFKTESLARSREKFFKTGKGRVVLNNILNNA